MILTNETVQSIIEDKNERFKVISEETLDQWKDKSRKILNIRDFKEGKELSGVITLDNNNKVINVKEFK